jgi:hypothetical protein
MVRRRAAFRDDRVHLGQKRKRDRGAGCDVCRAGQARKPRAWGVGMLVPDMSQCGEKNKATGEQGWEDLPPGSMLEGLLLPPPKDLPSQTSDEPDLFAAQESPAASPPRPRDYRLLKIVTQPATAEQFARLGNDRAPVVRTASVYPEST